MVEMIAGGALMAIGVFIGALISHVQTPPANKE